MDLIYRMSLASWWILTLKIHIHAGVYTLVFLWGKAREFAERNEKMLRTCSEKKIAWTKKKCIPKMVGESFINS